MLYFTFENAKDYSSKEIEALCIFRVCGSLVVQNSWLKVELVQAVQRLEPKQKNFFLFSNDL